MRIVLGGVISRFLPGEVVLRAQYVEGLRRLGHEVVWVEQLEPKGCVDRHGQPTLYARCVNRGNFLRAMRYFGLEERAAQIYDDGLATVGLSLERVLELVSSASLLLNFSGHVRHPEILARIPRRAYMDPDPAFTQLWHTAYRVPLGLESHDVFLTRGVNIASGRAALPDCGLTWHPCMPPVVTDLWPATTDRGSRAFTTIAALGRYEDLEWKGEWFRSKASEFKRFAGLPARVPLDFGVALSGTECDPDVEARLLRAGWTVTHGRDLGSIHTYLSFIRTSGAEIGITKQAYVKGETGWFSERSTQYMACGRPVLVQDTGLDGVLPTGLGILTFRTLEGAVAGAQEIVGNYSNHSRAARELVEEHFDHRKLLPELLDRCFESQAPAAEATG